MNIYLQKLAIGYDTQTLVRNIVNKTIGKATAAEREDVVVVPNLFPEGHFKRLIGPALLGTGIGAGAGVLLHKGIVDVLKSTKNTALRGRRAPPRIGLVIGLGLVGSVIGFGRTNRRRLRNLLEERGISTDRYLTIQDMTPVAREKYLKSFTLKEEEAAVDSAKKRDWAKPLHERDAGNPRPLM